MAGSPEEYEKMCLASMRRASEDRGDPVYHHARAQLFALLALASATETANSKQGED
jgi:hypothetical protein